jgi:hypothetical protein
MKNLNPEWAYQQGITTAIQNIRRIHAGKNFALLSDNIIETAVRRVMGRERLQDAVRAVREQLQSQTPQ